jgi:hypothetical protein
MSHIAYEDDRFRELKELSNIMDDLRVSTNRVKKKLGDFGLFFAVPFTLFKGSIHLKKERKALDEVLNTLLQDFHKMDDRNKMMMERVFLSSTETLEQKMNRSLSVIEGRNHYFTKTYVKIARAILNDVISVSVKMTETVYPPSQSPANDPVLFKKLVKAYEGVDLSDWKTEGGSVYDSPLNKHAHV